MFDRLVRRDPTYSWARRDRLAGPRFACLIKFFLHRKQCLRLAPLTEIITRPRVASCILSLLLALAAACTGLAQPSVDREAAVATATPSAAPTVAVTAPARVAAEPTESSGELAYQHVKALAEEIGTRVVGTPAERRAAEYIADQFRSYGYTVTLQDFPVENTSATLEVHQGATRRMQGLPFNPSGSGEATGELVYIGLGRPGDLPAGGLRGKLALVRRGEIQFQEKVQNAARAGAVGVIVYNNQPGLVQGAVAAPTPVPALIISQEDGESLLAVLRTGPVTATISVKVETTTGVNVIARRRPGPCETVTGGHFDSVATSPGGNDNASGTAALLETSRVMAQPSYQRNNCFIAFGGEEEGLLGSHAFVQSLSQAERSQIAVMINLDMVGTASGLLLIGDDRLIDLARRGAQTLGIDVSGTRLPPNLGSDHQSFADAGIPVLMLHRNDGRLHTPQDTASIVQPESLRDAVRLTVWLLLQFT